MFDLDRSVANWRKKFSSAGISSVALDELESHLRETISASVAAGGSEADAFQMAEQRLGASTAIKPEFNKLRAANCNLTLARCAWVVFAISFFLPAYTDGAGWQCAWMSATEWTWRDFASGNWFSIHLVLLTPANLVMALTPFGLSKLSRHPRAINWLRGANFVALALVWSYVGWFFAAGGWHDLRIGCYVWTVSFLLMFVSLFRRPLRKEKFA